MKKTAQKSISAPIIKKAPKLKAVTIKIIKNKDLIRTYTNFVVC